MRSLQIGEYVQQPAGFKAFIANEFPPEGVQEVLSSGTQEHLNKALYALGKLDGITQLLPDLDFFLYMYVRKEAAYSSEIEGTQATMIDAIRKDVIDDKNMPRDVANILKYVEALNQSLINKKKLPLSSRFIRDMHRIILTDTPDQHGKTPGEYRTTQNWVGGATIETARYIPPPAHLIGAGMGELEKYIHASNPYSQLTKTALIHAQFETIHPFLDGNGRTGRLLIPVYLCHAGLLEKPVLYLSVYLRKHREEYFEHLTDYHDRGFVDPWLKFFFEGVSQVAESAISTARGINEIRERDQAKIRSLPPKRSSTADKLYIQLFTYPIVTAANVETWTGLSRPSANSLIKEFVRLKILFQRDKKSSYAREYEYRDYLSLFTKSF